MSVLADQRVPQRCEALEAAFKLFLRQIDCYVACFYEYQTTQVSCLGLRLSKTVLFDAVASHFRDLDRYKAQHGFPEGARANAAKVGAFTTFWLAAKRPIFDTYDEPYAAVVNDDFAIFTGLSLAEVDPHQARMFADGRIYGQIKSLLSSHAATSDTLVPLFETLAEKFPDVS